MKTSISQYQSPFEQIVFENDVEKHDYVNEVNSSTINDIYSIKDEVLFHEAIDDEFNDDFYDLEYDEYNYTMNLAQEISKEAYENDPFQDTEVAFEDEDDFDDEIEFEELYDDELELEKLLEDEIVGYKEPIGIPVKRAFPFAAVPPMGSYWPLISNQKKGKVVSFRYLEKPRRYVGNRSRSFLARRSNGKRYHAGIDLYANHKDKVVACEDGVIINFYHFYRSTYALIVEHKNIVINYGEVHKDSLKTNGLREGDRVSAGQVIGFAGKMHKSSMLHFEIYRKGTDRNLRWLKKDKAPYNLLNPTKYLLFLKEHGEIANGGINKTKGAHSSSTTSNNGSSWNDTVQKGKDAISNIFQKGKLISVAVAAISKGENDENKITNVVFYSKHPKRYGKKLKPNDPLVKEWLSIRKNVVRPLLKDTKKNGAYSTITTSGQTNSSSSTNKNVRIYRGSGWGGWKGNGSKGTTKIPSEWIKNKFDVAVAVASVPEGGSFDNVNMYDKGILSWGIKQWTIHAGSLQGLLSFIQKGLAQKGRPSLWDQLFPGIRVNNNTLIYRGQAYPTSNSSELMRLFRGSSNPKSVNNKSIDPWIIMFAIAGRHPLIQKFQFEYAKRELREKLMLKNLGKTLKNNGKRCNTKQSWCRELKSFGSSFKPENYGAIGKYIGENMKSLALINGMATQNPMWTYIYLKRAIDVLIARHNTANTDSWSGNWQNEFSIVLENLFTKSGVATWGTAGVKNYARKHPKKKLRQSRTSKLLAAYSKYSSHVSE